MPHLYRQITKQDLKGYNAQAFVVDQSFVAEIKNEVLNEIATKSATDGAPPVFTFSEDESFPTPELIYSFDREKNIVGYKQLIPCKMTCHSGLDKNKEQKTAAAEPKEVKEADATLTIELVPVYQDGVIIGTERIVTFVLNEQVLDQYPALENIFPNTDLQLELHRIKQRAKQSELEQKIAEIIALNTQQLEKFTATANKITAEITAAEAAIDADQAQQYRQLLIMALLLPEESELFTNLQAQLKALQDLRNELTKFEAAKKLFFTPNYVAWLQAYQKKAKQLLAVIQQNSAKIKKMISAFSDNTLLAGLSTTQAKADFLSLPQNLFSILFSSSDTTIPSRLRKLYRSLSASAQSLLATDVGQYLERLRELEIADSLWPNGEKEPNFYQANCFHDVLSACKIWHQQGRLTFKIVLDFYRKYYADLKKEYRNELNAWLQQSDVLPGQNKQQAWDVVADRVWWRTNDGADFSKSSFEETFLVFKTRTEIYEPRLINWYQQCYANWHTAQKKQVEVWRKTTLPVTTAQKLGVITRNVKPSSSRMAENWERLETSEKILLATIGILGSVIIGIGAIGVYFYLNRRRDNEHAIYPNQFERVKKIKPAATTQKRDTPNLLSTITARFLSAKKLVGRPSKQIMQQLKGPDPTPATDQAVVGDKTAISDDKQTSVIIAADQKSTAAPSPQSKEENMFFGSLKSIAAFANKAPFDKIFMSDTLLQKQVFPLALSIRETLNEHFNSSIDNPIAILIGTGKLIGNIAKILELILCQTIAPLKDKALLARAFLKDILPSQCRSLDLTPLFQEIFATALSLVATHKQINGIKTSPQFTVEDAGKHFLDMTFLPDEIFNSANKIKKSIGEYEKSLRPWWPAKKEKIKNDIAKVLAAIIKNQDFPICPIFSGQRFMEVLLPKPIYTSITEIFSIKELFAATMDQLAKPSEISPGKCLSNALEFFRNIFAIEANQEHTLNATVQVFYEKGLNNLCANTARIDLRNELRGIVKDFLKTKFVEVPTIHYVGNTQAWNGDGPIDPPVKTRTKNSAFPAPVPPSLPIVITSPIATGVATNVPIQPESRSDAAAHNVGRTVVAVP